MGLFEHFPYSNFHELNLSWLLKGLKSVDKEVDDLSGKVDDLQQQVDSLDIKGAVDEKIDEMADNGYFDDIVEDIMDVKYPLKTRELGILRVGRLLDNYGYNNATPVLGGQSICYDGSKFYACGGVGTGIQSISVWDSSGIFLTSATFTQLGHANSITVFGNYLYIADGSSAQVHKVVKSTLTYDSSLDLSAIYGGVYGVDSDGDKVYILGNTIGDWRVRQIMSDDGSDNFTPVCTFIISENRVNQGFAVRDGYAYAIMGQSNMLYKVDMATSNIVFAYYLPAGDGWNPAGEYEDIFKMGSELRIATALYYNYNASDMVLSPVQEVTLGQIFATDIDGVLQKNIPYEYMQGETTPRLACNESYTYSFNPFNNYTTIEEACYIANYLQKGVINASNIGHGLIRLSGGVYVVNGISGTRSVDQIDVEEAWVHVSQLSTKDLLVNGAEFCIQNCGIDGEIDVWRSRVMFDTVWLTNTQYIYVRRCDVEFREVRAVNASLAVGLPGGAANNHVRVYSPFVNNVLKLAKITGAAHTFIKVMCANNRFFNVNVATSYIGGAWAATVYNESLYNQFEEVSGGSYRVRDTNNTYTAMTGSDYLDLDA